MYSKYTVHFNSHFSHEQKINTGTQYVQSMVVVERSNTYLHAEYIRKCKHKRSRDKSKLIDHKRRADGQLSCRLPKLG